MRIQALTNTQYLAHSQKNNNGRSVGFSNNVSFEGKENASKNWFQKLKEHVYGRIADTYGKALLNSKVARKMTSWLSDVDKTNASKHFQVLGALVTSTGYAVNTMKKKDFEKKDARTLAINQSLGFVVPTALGYIIDSRIASKTKQAEYKYIAKRERELALGNYTKEEIANAQKNLSKGIAGFRVLMAIITFTTLYRFVVPVAITPLANKIGHYIDEKKELKAQKIMEKQGLDKAGDLKDTIELTKEDFNKTV